MKGISNRIYLVTKLFFYAVLITGVAACDMTHPGTHQLAIDLATELKAQVCRVPFRPGDPCGDRDVRSEGDSGIATYVNIYGVNDQKEMQLLADTATKFRDGRGESDRRIPVHITFYAELKKPNTFNKPKVVYVVTLKGEN